MGAVPTGGPAAACFGDASWVSYFVLDGRKDPPGVLVTAETSPLEENYMSIYIYFSECILFHRRLDVKITSMVRSKQSEIGWRDQKSELGKLAHSNWCNGAEFHDLGAV